MHLLPTLFLILLLIRSDAAAATPPAGRGNEYEQIAPSVWIHTSYHDLGTGVPIPSNGLLVLVGDELVLVDTAWTAEQTAEILEWAESETGLPVGVAIVTHAHGDKMGGMEALRERGIPTLASRATNEAALSRGLMSADRSLDLDPSEVIAPGVEAFFPGPGHTRDNIVIYVADADVLFGGCLIRPGDSGTLGNTTDAAVDKWSESVLHLIDRYPDAEIVIPSHGGWGDRTLLDHTVDLARKADDTLPDQP